MLGFKLPFYRSATLLLSLGLSLRVLWHLARQRPQVRLPGTPAHVTQPAARAAAPAPARPAPACGALPSHSPHVPSPACNPHGTPLQLLHRPPSPPPTSRQVIHVSTPGVMCFAAVLYARLLAVPLVMSYHTHIPEYIPRYTWSGLVAPMWSIIRWLTRRADLTLVTSKAMKVR